MVNLTRIIKLAERLAPKTRRFAPSTEQAVYTM